jgi:hypothetical protein
MTIVDGETNRRRGLDWWWATHMQVSATCVLVSISEYSVVVFCLVPEEFIHRPFIYIRKLCGWHSHDRHGSFHATVEQNPLGTGPLPALFLAGVYEDGREEGCIRPPPPPSPVPPSQTPRARHSCTEQYLRKEPRDLTYEPAIKIPQPRTAARLRSCPPPLPVLQVWYVKTAPTECGDKPVGGGVERLSPS